MAGQMGSAKVKVRNLKVVNCDVEQNLLIVCGAVPGSPGSYLMVEESL
jgi:large subunit ribosomal protein L3